jgi:endonuclease YncB( thermonuclease family)
MSSGSGSGTDTRAELAGRGYRGRWLVHRCPLVMRSPCEEHGAIRRRGKFGAARAPMLVFLVSIAVFASRPVLGFAAEPAPASSAPSAAPAPAVEEWLNQNVRLRVTLQAVDRPSSAGKPFGEIRAGAEVKAIGLVAGKQWVEIELPDHSLAYVPRGEIEFENNAAAPAGEQSAAPSGGKTATPPATSAAATPAAATSAAAAPAAAISAAAATLGVVRGPATRVPNAATLVVADQRLRLSGIDPGPQEVLAPFESWVRSQGALTCEPDAQTGRYHCFTNGGIDVAEAAILNGAGRVGDGATPAYRASETQARQGRRGLWQGP